MEARTNWGILAVASGAALILIGLSLWYGLTRGDEVSVAPTPLVTSGSETEMSTEWRAALDAIATKEAEQKPGEYRAPEELGPTQAVSQELVATYFKLKAQNKLGTKAADDALNELIDRNVVAIPPRTVYTAATTLQDPGATLDSYAEGVGSAMERSASIREYELTTFARTVGTEDYDGTPALLSAARVYRSIETDLRDTRVPPALADEHAAVLTSVSYLAQSVELMGGWTGDPLDALSYVDAFVKAERQSQVAFNALFAAMVEFGKAS